MEKSTTIDQVFLLKISMADSLTSFKSVFQASSSPGELLNHLTSTETCPPLTITLISVILPSYFFCCYGTVFTFQQMLLYNLFIHYVVAYSYCLLLKSFLQNLKSLRGKISIFTNISQIARRMPHVQ